MAEQLFERCAEIGFAPAHAVEIGVFTPDCCSLQAFIEHGCRVELFEPNPEVFRQLQAAYRAQAQVTVYPFAIAEASGPVLLYRCGASSFLSGIPDPPAQINDHYQPRDSDAIGVEARTFDEFDDGTIDVLAMDTEGAEWYALRGLRSRPRIIAVEMESRAYRNPFYQAIETWMGVNGCAPSRNAGS